MTQRETIAVIGAGGTMGLAMARNLARAGLHVRAWNRSREKAEPLADDGAVLCQTPAEATRDATVILTMLSDAGAVLDVMGGDIGAPPTDTIWLQMSTVGLEGTRRCAELAERLGLAFVD